MDPGSITSVRVHRGSLPMNGSYIGVSAIAISPNRTIYDAEAAINETKAIFQMDMRFINVCLVKSGLSEPRNGVRARGLCGLRPLQFHHKISIDSKSILRSNGRKTQYSPSRCVQGRRCPGKGGFNSIVPKRPISAFIVLALWKIGVSFWYLR